MAIERGYLTLAEFKEALNIQGDTQDARIERVIEAASRRVDTITGRSFYLTEEETRYYDVGDGMVVDVDDLATITSIATDDGNLTYPIVWATTDYDLLPYNAASLGRPYSAIQVASQGRYAFPRGARTLRIVGTFGWTEPPSDVKEATFLIANRLLRRKDAPFGVLGSSEFGQVSAILKEDPDAMNMLAPYRRMTIGAV